MSTVIREKVREVRAKTAGRRVSAQDDYQFEQIGRYATDAIAAGDALQREWFCDSICMVHIDGEKETYFLARSPDANKFLEFNVVHWTHWVGRLTTQLRDVLDNDLPYPESLVYGPLSMPHKIVSREIGPWVRYQFTNGQLADYLLQDRDGTDGGPAEASSTAVGSDSTSQKSAKSSFGLKDIIELRDLKQDDQIRGPMAGVYILTGGPGVGKTSVALHRIPYLLMQQREQLPAEMPSVPKAVLENFFRVETMQVVVWKEHLVPYLRECLKDLRFDKISVLHVEDWVAKALRDYVAIGVGKSDYRIAKTESEELRCPKLGRTDSQGVRWAGLTEKMLTDYLTGRDGDEYHYPAAAESAADLADLCAELNDMFSGHPLRVKFPSFVVEFAPTVANVESATNALKQVLDRLAVEVSEMIRQIKYPPKKGFESRKNGAFQSRTTDVRPYEDMRTVITSARAKITKVRDKAVARLTADYPAALAGFYAAKIVTHALTTHFGQIAADQFGVKASERVLAKRLSESDRYLLLWIIHITTRGGASTDIPARPLIQYSHTVVDEAQYYHPLVLRLLVSLAMPPLGSVTIVGDLEQRVSSEGGLVGWEDVGIQAEVGKVFRLNTNYRWSQKVFEFLDVYRQFADLRELKSPRKWASGAGAKPVVVSCDDEDDEIEWLTKRLAEAWKANWSSAVIVPPFVEESWRKQLIEALASCDIRSHWAVGEDIRECREKVILTDYESVVGLEFDAVFLPSCHKVLVPPTPDTHALQAAWVALTRARQFVAVSYYGPIAVFGDKCFKSYRLRRT